MEGGDLMDGEELKVSGTFFVSRGSAILYDCCHAQAQEDRVRRLCLSYAQSGSIRDVYIISAGAVAGECLSPLTEKGTFWFLVQVTNHERGELKVSGTFSRSSSGL